MGPIVLTRPSPTTVGGGVVSFELGRDDWWNVGHRALRASGRGKHTHCAPGSKCDGPCFEAAFGVVDYFFSGVCT